MALGAALRFSFHVFYLRLGIANFEVKQSLEISDEDSRAAEEEIYQIEEKAWKSGVLFGAGVHRKLGKVRDFVDYTRYQIIGVGDYDKISAGVSFALLESLFSFRKY
jgi:hypothetical protein